MKKEPSPVTQQQLEETTAFLRQELRDQLNLTTHHIRTSLVNLRGFSREVQHACGSISEILRQEENPLRAREEARRIWATEIEEALGFINRSVDRMENYLSGTTRLVRLVSCEPRIETCDVQELVRKVAADASAEARSRELEIEIGQLPRCQADSALLRHVFHEIIENALQFADRRKKSWLRITGTLTEDRAIYRFADNGLGIDSSQAESLLEPYQKLTKNPASDGHLGTGLAIALRLTRLMGGRLNIGGELDKGAWVSVELPNE